MKNFFSRNRKVVEILLTLVLVFITGGYYYLIYIPERESEIIERRFRTLQRIEGNMSEKFQGYISTIRNCFTKADEMIFANTVKEYNKDPDKFRITILDSEEISKGYKSKSGQPFHRYLKSLNDSINDSIKVNTSSNGKKLTIDYSWYKLLKNKKDVIKHVSAQATINYKEFVVPLLRKNVFDHYIVFNVCKDTSNIIFEDFQSGISFISLDSLFDVKEKVYSSKIIRLKTGGEKYLAFLHPCGYNRKNERIIVGLLKQETFDKEKQQLPERMITTILFVALFSFLLLPVIRLALMGKKERIRFFDLFAGYFSFLLLVPVIILVFFWNKEHFFQGEIRGKSSKKILADQISRNFNNEITSAYTLLEAVDSIYSSEDDFIKPIRDYNIHHLNKNAEVHIYGNTGKKKGLDLIAEKIQLSIDSSGYKNAESVFWMDSASGKEMANWAFGEDPPRGNYKERNYFKNVRDNNLISLNNNPVDNFAFEPIVSRTDGKFKVIIAKKSRTKGLIAAMASRFTSVINPLLPLGYSYTITNDVGKVIFDTDTTHNLNENVLEEFIEFAPFKVVLDTKTSCEFKTRYEDEDYNILAQPITGLPYFIIILEKQSFRSSLNTQCFSFTMMMMFSFFLFLCIEMTIILICHYRQTKLLKNSLDFSWIHPRESLSHNYFFLFLFNICLLAVLSLFCFTCFSIQNLTGYIFLFMMAALLSSIAACACRAKAVAQQRGGEKKVTRKFISMIALSALAITVILSSLYFDVIHNVLLFSLVSILIFIILIPVSRLLKGKGANDYLTNFRLMIFSKLVLTSGLPVIVFFLCIYNFELRLEERLKLLNYAENISNHLKNSNDHRSFVNLVIDSNSIKSFYTDSVWIADIGEATDSLTSLTYSKADNICISLLKTSRVHYNDVSGTTENFELLKPFGNDSNQFGLNSIFSGPVNKLSYRITRIDNDSAVSKYIALSSSGLQEYKTPYIFDMPHGFIFWMLLCASLAFCYQLLKYALNKIFGKNIPDTEEFKAMNQKLLVDENIKYLFVQGIPGSDKSTYICNHLTENGKFVFCSKMKSPVPCNAKILSLDQIPDHNEISNEKTAFEKQSPGNYDCDNWYYKISECFKDEITCIVFTHFEYKIFDDHTNTIKLNLIEKFIRSGKKKIIISSDIDPVEYFHSLKKFMYDNAGNRNQKTDSKNDAKQSGKEPVANAAFFEYINRWNNLLGRFTNVYADNHLSAENEAAKVLAEDFLISECSQPVFLSNYQSQFKALGSKVEREDNILKIQSLSDHSYRHIWSSLTKEEQLTLYDLAEDGLINTTNYISLTMLLNKGLVLKKDGVLKIMNRSFRNFILTVVNSAEVKSIEKEIDDGQTWNDYKYPVLIILGALLYFVLSSNPEKFGNILPVITGVMAGIPTILKLLSYMKPGDSNG